MRIRTGLVIIGLLIGACLPDAPAGDRPSRDLTIVAGTGRHVFRVEVADSHETQARGLMFRRALARDAGMLFLYPTSGPITMWMKNTYIPLDMLFIDKTGRITHIVERTVPLSTEIIRSNGPARAVLEVNGGTVGRLGIGIGDRVLSPFFGDR